MKKRLIYVGVYVAQYFALFWILFALNRLFGLEISTDAFSISMPITAMITGIPLFLWLCKVDISKWIIAILALLHYLIISLLWSIVIVLGQT